jgi:GT2 family glycosyltransferase
MSESDVLPVSLVICTRDREQLLEETIASMLAADVVPQEIVVVDQSNPRSAAPDRLQGRRGTEIRVVRSTSRGLGRARNEGVAAARHDVVVFVDDDMFAHPRWLAQLVGALRDSPPRTVVTGAVAAAPAESWRGFTPSTQDHAPGAVFAGRLDRDVLAGGHMAIERSALEEVGGFDPRLGAGAPYPAADDNDLGFRLLERGYRIAYVADSILYHRAWRPGWRYPIVRWRYGRGKGGFYVKHMRSSDRHMVRRARNDLTPRLRRFPRLLLRSPALAVGDLAYVAGVVAGGTRWWLRERG